MNIPEDPLDRLRDELATRGWTQQKFAHVLGRPPQAISEILNGKKQITVVTAAQFGAALDTDADMWLRMQAAYNLWQLNLKDSFKAELATIADRAKRA